MNVTWAISEPYKESNKSFLILTLVGGGEGGCSHFCVLTVMKLLVLK
jgi:hypothetical protein